MAPQTRSRRREALTRERIVGEAVALLDRDGEAGLTFRALTERLATGPGAIYHHVANKDELLGAATEDVLAAALTAGRADDVRAAALGLFEAAEAHPWLAPQISAQLARRPWGPVAPLIFESLGRPVRGLGVPRELWFTATSALMHYVLGAAGLNAVNSVTAGAAGLDDVVDRVAFLDAAATSWEALDPEDYPFTRAVADRLRVHDDRDEFLAGLDLLLAGLTARSVPPG